MKFASIVVLALPAVALAQTSSPASTDIPTPTGPPDLSVCKKQADTYADACPKCNPKCVGSSAYENCLYSIFSTINYIQSQCWQHGGRSCREDAINQVCG
ncbi:uncharacterized protein F4812DRAFT_463585 [Daldinia caldariorum]|uniref:uncharacterized protein n=1 Tax=Daldinia caldariorum TaxID=326644 RepID=UPI0020078041|nr:uncharacterized protein F4812DRAFT_463585 [Daldinia caldariorum]KAI1463486.1 hypothetical protein F4812DRAFT_463585 [Daldinia caldariorum]